MSRRRGASPPGEQALGVFFSSSGPFGLGGLPHQVIGGCLLAASVPCGRVVDGAWTDSCHVRRGTASRSVRRGRAAAAGSASASAQRRRAESEPAQTRRRRDTAPRRRSDTSLGDGPEPYYRRGPKVLARARTPRTTSTSLSPPTETTTGPLSTTSRSSSTGADPLRTPRPRVARLLQ